MALKPMDKRNGRDSRQAVWEAIRQLREFTVRELRNKTLLTIESVRDYVLGLTAAGYLKAYPQPKGFVTVYALSNDVGAEAPRVRKDGTPVTQGDGRKNMWEAMRILRTFTPRELAVAASMPDCLVKESTAADYAKHLCHAGYLRKFGDSYMFLPTAYTGPLAPMIQRTKRVWDPNQQKVRWRSDEGVSDDE
ncbi:MAG: hypothetical protein LBD10_14570 [Desulfobulbus sp.]|jgi:hypothetical protein|uniref:large ribosomal subunit protein bL28 n=1 Tax=Desulfobulbus sp. TaxID=895 RepID=UPI00284A2794|nr:hypothetical protein [Desulfobulbus sp.]MDR2551413.1 hypothetical protein [Desulfobulbus sp.]